MSDLDNDDSLLDFKSPVRRHVPQVKDFGKSNVHQNKRTVSKSKRVLRSNKEAKITHIEQSQPSIESSFFKSKKDDEKHNPPNSKIAHVCPLCFKTFKDFNSHTLHMKICACKNNVPTKKLLDAIELQEKQEDERKLLGLPTGPIIHERKKTVSHKTSLHEESDIELALALSKSLQEAEDFDELEDKIIYPKLSNRFEATSSESTCVPHLEKYGFANSKPLLPLKNKKRKNCEFSILQTRTQEERNNILTERISEILIGNEPITQTQITGNKSKCITEQTLVLTSRLLCSLLNKEARLWNKANLSEHQKYFYVTSLSKHIIPKEVQKEEVLDVERTSNMCANTTECESEPLNKHEKDEEMCNQADPISEKCENCSNKQCIETTVKKWADVLNDSSASNIMIFVDNDKYIWAHKLVFYVQCPNILLDVVPNDSTQFSTIKEKICWLDISYNIALAFLEFIYCGIIAKYSNVLEDQLNIPLLRKLARKYKVKELFAYLEKEHRVKQDNEKVHVKHNEEFISEEKANHLVVCKKYSLNLDLDDKDLRLSDCDEILKEEPEQSVAKELTTINATKNKNTSANISQQEKRNCSNIGNSSLHYDASLDLFDEDIIVCEQLETAGQKDATTNYETGFPDSNKPNMCKTLSSPEFANNASIKGTSKLGEEIKETLGSQKSSTPKVEDYPDLTKQKSNISLFIERFKQENAKSDVDTDIDVSVVHVSPKLSKNPFNVKHFNISKENSINNARTKMHDKTHANILSIFDCTTNRNSSVNESYVRNDIEVFKDPLLLSDITVSSEFTMNDHSEAHMQNISQNTNANNTEKQFQNIETHPVLTIGLLDKRNECFLQASENKEFVKPLTMSQDTKNECNLLSDLDSDEEEISVYSKYKRGHENNSISQYRNYLQKHVFNSNNDSDTESDDSGSDNNLSLNLNEISEFVVNQPEKDNYFPSDTGDRNSLSVDCKSSPMSIEPNTQTPPLLHSESFLDVSVIHEFEDSKSKADLSRCKSDCALENNSDNTNDSLLIQEVSSLNDDILDIFVQSKNNATSMAHNFSKDLNTSENSEVTKHKDEDAKAKCMLEMSSHFNTNYSNKTQCETSSDKVGGENIYHEITPPPNYNGMLTPELHSELKKYGLKIQKRKRAIKLLNYIYNELHPTVSMTTTNTAESEFVIMSSEDDEPMRKKMSYQKEIDNFLDDCDLLQSEESKRCMMTLNSVIGEEKLCEKVDPRSETNIKEIFQKIITANQELYNKILAYEPVCINSLHSILKAEGFKFKVSVLMDFLDEQCITYYHHEKCKEI